MSTTDLSTAWLDVQYADRETERRRKEWNAAIATQEEAWTVREAAWNLYDSVMRLCGVAGVHHWTGDAKRIVDAACAEYEAARLDWLYALSVQQAARRAWREAANRSAAVIWEVSA